MAAQARGLATRATAPPAACPICILGVCAAKTNRSAYPQVTKKQSITVAPARRVRAVATTHPLLSASQSEHRSFTTPARPKKAHAASIARKTDESQWATLRRISRESATAKGASLLSVARSIFSRAQVLLKHQLSALRAQAVGWLALVLCALQHFVASAAGGKKAACKLSPFS